MDPFFWREEGWQQKNKNKGDCFEVDAGGIQPPIDISLTNPVEQFCTDMCEHKNSFHHSS